MLTSQYFIAWLIMGLIISSIPFYISFGLLTKRFFIWYRSNKNNIIVLCYSLAIPSTLIGTAMIDTGLYVLFLDSPIVIDPSTARSQSQPPKTSPSYSMKEISNLFLSLATVILIIAYLQY